MGFGSPLCVVSVSRRVQTRTGCCVHSLQKRPFFSLQGILLHRLAIILIYHARILLERLEVPMPRILLHLNDVGTTRQVVRPLGAAQVSPLPPFNTASLLQALIPLLSR